MSFLGVQCAHFNCIMQRHVILLSPLLLFPLLGSSSCYPEPEPGSNFKSLGHYNVEPYMTVSGISAGAAFSMMLSFIYSSFVKGAGIFAGAPFPVGLVALEKPWYAANYSALSTWIDRLASKGWIDDPRLNMPTNLGAFIYAGKADQVVPHFFSQMNLRQFKEYGVPRVLDVIGKVPSGHCVPVNASGEAYDIRLCSIGSYGAICACGYPGVYEMFKFLYKETYVAPDYEPGTSGHLFKFNQDEFFDSGKATENGFFPHGWAYVPTRCRRESGIRCKLHFAFQGCSQTLIDLWILKKVPGFVGETGYMEVADANDIIVVWPVSFFDPKKFGFNFIGCYDLYSYTDPYRLKFSTKWGVQPLAIRRMFERIAFGKISSRDEYPIEDPDEYKKAHFGRKLTGKYIRESVIEAFKAIGRLGE